MTHIVRILTYIVYLATNSYNVGRLFGIMQLAGNLSFHYIELIT